MEEVPGHDARAARHQCRWSTIERSPARVVIGVSPASELIEIEFDQISIASTMKSVKHSYIFVGGEAIEIRPGVKTGSGQSRRGVRWIWEETDSWYEGWEAQVFEITTWIFVGQATRLYQDGTL